MNIDAPKETYEEVPDLRSFGKRLRKRREDKGLSLGDLGAKVGLSGSSVCSLERGVSTPRPYKFCALCTILDVPFDLAKEVLIEHRVNKLVNDIEGELNEFLPLKEGTDGCSGEDQEEGKQEDEGTTGDFGPGF